MSKPILELVIKTLDNHTGLPYDHIKLSKQTGVNEMTVTIKATHESGSIITITGKNAVDSARTIELMKQCGYVKIEISNN